MRQIAKYFMSFLAIIVAVSSMGAVAFGASEAVTLEKAKLALLDGGEGKNGQILSGLSIALSKGVKTYWRMPGDSGLPPIFDFSASRNVERVEIAWPAPSRLKDAVGTILGYEDNVIFPFIVTPRDPKAPVMLALTIDFGLCDTLCLPAKAFLSRDLASGGAARSSIESFLARVPKRIGLNADQSPHVQSVEAKVKPPVALVLSLRSTSPLKDVILEGPETWYFGQAHITRSGEDVYRVTIPVEQKPSSASFSGLGVIITAIAEDGATETSVTLDATESIQ